MTDDVTGEGSVAEPPETLVPAKEIDELVAKREPTTADPPAPPEPPHLTPEVKVKEPAPWAWWVAFGAFCVGTSFLVYHVWKARKERRDEAHD